MQQPGQPSNYNVNANYNELLMLALNPMIKQLDRLEERTRDLATRSDLETLRKELVARDALEPQLTTLRAEIERANTDRVNDRDTLEKRIDKLESDQISRRDRLWIRLGQVISIAAFALALFGLLSHIKFLP